MNLIERIRQRCQRDCHSGVNLGAHTLAYEILEMIEAEEDDAGPLHHRFFENHSKPGSCVYCGWSFSHPIHDPSARPAEDHPEQPDWGRADAEAKESIKAADRAVAAAGNPHKFRENPSDHGRCFCGLSLPHPIHKGQR